MNPYYHSPFMMNPLMRMMMHINMMPMNPYEGNGLLHPVYVPPAMMDKLQRSVPPPLDAHLDNAKAGNMDCSRGATVSCMATNEPVRSIDTYGHVNVHKVSVPEKVSCFAGCADFNPCDTNLYNSFIKSEFGCDGNTFFYYTCETFEALDVFSSACASHSAGAKVDVPLITANTISSYEQWKTKVMKYRKEGRGREVMYEDDSVEPGMGYSIGAGKSGDAPVSDKELGNVRDYGYVRDKLARKDDYADVMLREEDEDYDNVYDEQHQEADTFASYRDQDSDMQLLPQRPQQLRYRQPHNEFATLGNDNHQQIVQTIIACVWGVVVTMLLMCVCCAISAGCGLLVKRGRNAKKRVHADQQRRAVHRDIESSGDDHGMLNDESVS